LKLICDRCAEVDPGAVVDGPTEWTCVRCGHALTSELADYVDWAAAVLDVPGIGRYANLLPAREPADLQSADTALRPIDCPALAERLGVKSVHLVPQTLNEAGTFKDNEAVLLAAKSREWGLSAVCMHSSGNTARAYQHYMDRAGVECTGFVPRASVYKCPRELVGRSAIHAVDGNMITAADAALAHSKATGALRLTPSIWKIEGKVPLGLAIAEHCPGTTTIAVTIASGYGPLGMERGIRRVEAVGLPGPRNFQFRLFQAADASVLGEAIWAGGDIDLDKMVPPEQAFEPTLQSTNPNKTLPLVRELLARTRSRIDAVEPDLVEVHRDVFTAVCAEAGIPLDYGMEKSAYICWAGLAGAARAGRLAPTERITIIVSGSAPHPLLL